MARNLAGSPIQKYCEILDEFVKIRVFTDDEIAELLRSRPVPNRTAYQHLVVTSCIVNFEEEVVPLFKSKNRIPCKTSALEELLYQICVEVNPQLEIHQVALPVGDEAEGGQLSLLSHPSLANQKSSKRDLDRVEAELRRAVIGQDAAIDSVVKAFRKAAAGIRDPRRPIGTFMLVGSTGTGKTELAKMVSRHLFGDGTRLVRIDCSEYALPHEYAKLIGAPPGYVGHNEGGHLTEQMKDKKVGVVLFDEIEKAHKKVHNLLLQIMDEGFLTDSKGQVVPFNRSFILLTSNVGVEEISAIRDRVGFDWKARTVVGREQTKDATLDAMKHAFRPEFINRLDGVLMFNSLTEQDCVRIARNQLEQVAGYLRQGGIELRFAPSVAREIARQGFNPEYGARELRRLIQTRIEEPLSERILAGEFRGGDTVRVTACGERFGTQRIGRAKPGAVAPDAEGVAVAESESHLDHTPA